MAKKKMVTLSKSNFSLLPEGNYTFKIVKAEYDEDFGKISLKLETADGESTVENFTLVDVNGEINEGALRAFSFFARVATGDNNIEEIDPTDLKDCYINADVEHYTYESKKSGKEQTGARLKNYKSANGFDEDDSSDEVEENEDPLAWLND